MRDNRRIHAKHSRTRPGAKNDQAGAENSDLHEEPTKSEYDELEKSYPYVELAKSNQARAERAYACLGLCTNNDSLFTLGNTIQ